MSVKLKEQKGMGLIQVMIALGLMSVIGLGVAELMVTSANVSKRSDTKLSQLLLMNELQALSSSENLCTQAIKAEVQKYDHALAQATGDGLDIEFKVSDTQTFKKGFSYDNKLKIKRLYIHESVFDKKPSANETLYRVKLKIEFDTENENLIGGQLRDKDIGLIYITVNDSTDVIEGCTKIAETDIVKLCDDLGGSYKNGSCENLSYSNCGSKQHGELYYYTTSGGCPPKPSYGCKKYFTTGTRQCLDGNIRTINSSKCGWSCPSAPPPAWSCFTSETIITMHDSQKLPISQVQIGDYVMGEDGAINEVYDIEVVPLGGRQLFSFNDGPHFVTAEHPFKTTRGWASFDPEATYYEHFFQVKKQALEAGDLLYKSDQSIEMLKKISMRKDLSNLKVYNLRLKASVLSPYNDKDDRSHTYYANGYLVHNK